MYNHTYTFVYMHLCIRKRFTHTKNQTVLRRVITETKALDESDALSQIRGILNMYMYNVYFPYTQIEQ